MTSTLARIKKAGKNFEIMADADSVMNVKNDLCSFIDVEGNKIFSNAKKGKVAPSADLMVAFGTTDVMFIALKIIKEGEIQTTQEQIKK